MKKSKAFSLLLVLVTLLSLLAGCECKHDWKDATCEAPKTCSLCSKTEGEKLEHQWADATCEAPKTCSLCSKTEGEKLEHQWVDATCEAPKTCSLCSKTEGEKLEHQWVDATTEAPKTCSLCGKTEGDKITTDPRFDADACKDLFGTWKAVYAMSGADMELADFPGTIEMEITMTFHNDGRMEMSIGFKDPDAFKQSLCQYLVDLLYQTFESQGMTKEQADAACLENTGKSIADYAAEQAELAITSAGTTMDMVYYVADGKIYAAENWDETLEPADFTLENGVLKMQDSDMGELEFHPAAA